MKSGGQRGVAIVMALLLTALAVSIVAGLFWRQQVQIRLVENERLRLQAQWLLRGALSWERQVLADDDRRSAVDYQGEPWSRPLAATMPVTAANGGEAELGGALVDAQGRFNLANLSDEGQIDPIATGAFARLLSGQGINGELAWAVARAIAATQRGNDAGRPRMRFWQLGDLLAVPGFDAAMVARLRGLVVALPDSTPINLNTAPPEVVAALYNIPLSQAEALVAERARAYFRDGADLATRSVTRTLPQPDGQITFSSHYFLARCGVQIGKAELHADALIQRDSGQTWVLWERQGDVS